MSGYLFTPHPRGRLIALNHTLNLGTDTTCGLTLTSMTDGQINLGQVKISQVYNFIMKTINKITCHSSKQILIPLASLINSITIYATNSKGMTYYNYILFIIFICKNTDLTHMLNGAISLN